MAALCEMKLNLQLALSSPEAEIPLAFVDELEDEEGQAAAVGQAPAGAGALRGADSHGAELPVRDRAAGQRAELPGQARPQDPNPGFPRFGTGNPPVWKIDGGEPLGAGHWPEEERRQWYRERPADREYYRIQRELLRDGFTRKAKLTQLPPHQQGEPTLWAIGFEGKSPLRLPEAEHYPLHVSLAFDDELTEQQRSGAWSGRRPCTSTSSPAAPPASSPSSGTPWPTRRACSGPAPPATMASDGRCTLASSKDGGTETRRLPRQAQL